MDKIKRAFSPQQTDAPAPAPLPRESTPSTAPSEPEPPQPRPNVARVARSLVAQYPEGVPPEVLDAASAAEGVNPDTVRRRIETDSRPPEPHVVRRRRIDPDALRVVDLTGLESVRMRVKGSAYTVSDTERRRQGGPEYLLIREPDNEIDPSAVAVYGVKGHRVGYLSAARAKMASPLLAQLGADAYKVSGTGATKTSIVLWVDVPKADALRRFVRESAK